MNRIKIRFAIDQDHEQGRVVLLDGPKWSSQEQKQAETEIRGQYAALCNGQDTFVFKCKYAGLVSGTAFRVTRPDTSTTGRAQELLLEHTAVAAPAKLPQGPAWIGGFVEDLRKYCLPREGKEPLEPGDFAVAFAARHIVALAHERPDELLPRLLFGYLAVSEYVAHRRDEDSACMYGLAARWLQGRCGDLPPPPFANEPAQVPAVGGAQAVHQTLFARMIDWLQSWWS
jgi:hypothetical protein